MIRTFAIGIFALALSACGNTGTDDGEGVTEEADTPEISTPVASTPTSGEAFKAACMISATEEEIVEVETVCDCGVAALTASLSDEDLAIAAKAMTYDNPRDAREALAGETDDLEAIVTAIRDALEGCDT